jgi:hypothetical protein
MNAMGMGSTPFRRADGAAVEWRVAHQPVAYDDAVRLMEARAADIASPRRS